MSVTVKYLGCADSVPPEFEKDETLTVVPHPEFATRAQGGLQATSNDGRIDLVWAEEVDGDISSLFPTDVPEELVERYSIDTDAGRWRAALHFAEVHGAPSPGCAEYNIYHRAIAGRSMTLYERSALREMLLRPAPTQE